MTKPNKAFSNINLSYFCNNNHATHYSINGKKYSICKCNIEYNKNNNRFILYNGHSDLCNKNNKTKI